MMIDVDYFKKFNDRYGHQAGDEALQRIADVVDSFAKRPRDLAARYGPGVATISLGVAIVYPTLERSPEGAVQLADEALYVAKRDGRNCVRIFESEYQGLSTGTFRTQ